MMFTGILTPEALESSKRESSKRESLLKIRFMVEYEQAEFRFKFNNPFYKFIA